MKGAPASPQSLSLSIGLRRVAPNYRKVQQHKASAAD
jgi:hypothetical protein